jgi:hypothetical protein
MIKQLLTATALVAMVSTGAMAAETRPGASNDNGTGTTMTNDQMLEKNNAPAAGGVNRPGTESSTATMNAGDTKYGVTVFSQDRPTTPMTSQNGYVTGSQGQVLASTLIGKSVYSGQGEEAKKVGDVNDVLMSSDGKAEAIVIGVGGFLGVGEKDVAIQFDRLHWTVDKDNSKRLSIAASKTDLESAPAFRR